MEEQKKPEIELTAKELVAEIKSLCEDRMDAKTAGGILLADAIAKLDELVSKKKF